MYVQVQKDYLLLSQHKYVKDMLQKTGLTDATPLPTPLAINFLTNVESSQDDPPTYL